MNKVNEKTIGYVCAENPFEDRKAWSGTLYKIRESIENAGFNLIWIPYKRRNALMAFFTLWAKLTGRKLRDVNYPPIAWARSKTIDSELVNKCDILFFPGNAQIALYMKKKKPFIYYTDATIHQLVDFYFHDVDKNSLNSALQQEAKACQMALLNIRSSQWGIDSVVNDCKCEPSRCVVLEFGANIDSEEDAPPIQSYNEGELHLLFSGVNWERKGGRVAIETVEELRKLGVNAKLTIAGPKIQPKECENKDYVKYVGFLNKNNPEEYARYIDLWKTSHIFILPTVAECSATVFSEAAGFGIPVYTYNSGGISNYVINGYNGYAFPLGEDARMFAHQIMDDIKNAKIKEYSTNALRLSQERLSWEAWSSRFKAIMASL